MRKHEIRIGDIIIKNAEPTDNPRDLMVVMMPCAENIPEPPTDWALTKCPLCNQPCYAMPQLQAAYDMYKGRIVGVCTRCSLQASENQGSLPRLLQEKGITADEMIQPLLDLFKHNRRKG